MLLLLLLHTDLKNCARTPIYAPYTSSCDIFMYSQTYYWFAILVFSLNFFDYPLLLPNIKVNKHTKVEMTGKVINCQNVVSVFSTSVFQCFMFA